MIAARGDNSRYHIHIWFFQSHEVPIKPDEYDNGMSSNYMQGTSCDIFKRINAMLDNTLDLAVINNDQTKRKFTYIYYMIQYVKLTLVLAYLFVQSRLEHVILCGIF